MESFLAADISEYLGVNERAGSRSKGNTLDWGRDFSPARENVALRRTLNVGRGGILVSVVICSCRSNSVCQ